MLDIEVKDTLTDQRITRYVLDNAVREALLVAQTDQRITRYVLVSAVLETWFIPITD